VRVHGADDLCELFSLLIASPLGAPDIFICV